jgi:AcrR family transcriptional regulator
MTTEDAGGSDAMRQPQQDRSRATLARILDSARKAIADKNFDDATLSEVVAGAGVSVGAFYARFPDKAALLRFLEQEAYDDLGAALTAAAESEPPPTPSPLPPAAIVREMLADMARTYREHRGVLRTILARSRSDPEVQRRRMDFTAEFVGKGIARLQAAAATLEHPPSDRAWRIALLFASSALRDAILFDEDWWDDAGGAGSDELLVDELTAAVVAYLEIPDS